MFTGIVEGTGTVVALAAAPDGSAARLRLAAPWLAGDLAAGDSVAVNGCCVTVAALDPDGFTADLVAETLRRTALGGLRAGDRVNLERPLALGGRLFDGEAPTLVATTAAAPRPARDAWAAAGAEVLICGEGPGGVDLTELVKALGARDVLELLVEGGPRLHASFWAAGLADRLVWYLAPLVLGGDAAPGLLPGAGAATLAAGRPLRLRAVDRLGQDLRVIAEPERP